MLEKKDISIKEISKKILANLNYYFDNSKFF